MTAEASKASYAALCAAVMVWARQASNLRPADYEFLTVFRCHML